MASKWRSDVDAPERRHVDAMSLLSTFFLFVKKESQKIISCQNCAIVKFNARNKNRLMGIFYFAPFSMKYNGRNFFKNWPLLRMEAVEENGRVGSLLTWQILSTYQCPAPESTFPCCKWDCSISINFGVLFVRKFCLNTKRGPDKRSVS